MSPYWSQERLFGNWGPTNRVIFRILILTVVATLSLVVWALLLYGNYAHKLDAYVRHGRDERIASQKKQQDEINQINIAQRDAACYTATYFRKLLAPKKDPFIESLYDRYDCAHYKVPPRLPRALRPGPGAKSTPTSTPTRQSRSRAPGAAATPTLSPAAPSPSTRTATRIVTRPGPTVTRTHTRTATRTVTPPPPPPPSPSTSPILCVLEICLV